MKDSEDILLISLIQKKLVTWLSFCKPVGYSELYTACQKLINQEALLSKQDLKKSLFYQVVFPLIKVGIIEYGLSEEGNTIFFLPRREGDNEIIKRHMDNLSRFDVSVINKDKTLKAGIDILKRLPSIETYINTLEKEETEGFKARWNGFHTDLMPINPSDSRKPGLYKKQDLVFLPYYLVDKNGITHRIKSYRENLEGMDYAYSYISIVYEKKQYEFDTTTKTLRFLYMTVPPFVFRAMCLIDPTVLQSDDVYVGRNVSFHIPDPAIIKDIDRIYKVR